MKKAVLASLAITLACVATATPAFADVLYSDGSPGPGAQQIESPLALTDSFTLSQTSTITGADLVAWIDPGASLDSLEWSIGTSQFDTSLGSGTADPTAGSLLGHDGGYDIFEETFSIPSLTLGPGAYYLTLQDAVASDSGPVLWEVSNGSSTGEQYVPNVGTVSTGPNLFDILGTASATPEPSSLLLLSTGLLGLAGVLRRKLLPSR